MLKLSFLLILLVSCPAIGAEDLIGTFKRYGPNASLATIAEKMNALEKKFPLTNPYKGDFAPEAAVIDLIQDESVIPKNATLHVVGPGNNPYEWLLFAMYRPDVNLVVFTETELSVQDHQNPDLVMPLAEELYSSSRFPTEKIRLARVDLEKKVRQKEIRMLVDITAEHPTVPKADFVFAAMPMGGGVNFAKHAKPGAVGWVITNSGDLFSQVLPANPVLTTKFIPANYATTFLAPPKNSKLMCAHFIGGMANQHPRPAKVMIFQLPQ